MREHTLDISGTGGCLWADPPASLAAPATEMSGIFPNYDGLTEHAVPSGGLRRFLHKH